MNYEMMTEFINSNHIIELDVFQLRKKLPLTEETCQKITSLKFYREH